jgi:hypothetical protein
MPARGVVQVGSVRRADPSICDAPIGSNGLLLEHNAALTSDWDAPASARLRLFLLSEL